MLYTFKGHHDELENGYSYDLVHLITGEIQATGVLYERNGQFYIRIYRSVNHYEFIGIEVNYDFIKTFCWIMKSNYQ